MDPSISQPIARRSSPPRIRLDGLPRDRSQPRYSQPRNPQPTDTFTPSSSGLSHQSASTMNFMEQQYQQLMLEKQALSAPANGTTWVDHGSGHGSPALASARNFGEQQALQMMLEQQALGTPANGTGWVDQGWSPQSASTMNFMEQQAQQMKSNGGLSTSRTSSSATWFSRVLEQAAKDQSKFQQAQTRGEYGSR
jgi:hypothetical protein